MWEDPLKNEIVTIKFLESCIRCFERQRDNSFPTIYGHDKGGRALIYQSVMDILLGILHNNLERGMMGKMMGGFLSIEINDTRVK